MKIPHGFYIYAYLRAVDSKRGWLAQTPYYIGKGKGNRAWRYRRNVPRPKEENIVLLLDGLTEAAAFMFEKRLIQLLGRTNLGTGCLRNLTDGGEGASGAIYSEAARSKMREAKLGKPGPWLGKKRPEMGKTMSLANTGRTPWNKGKPGVTFSRLGTKWARSSSPYYGVRWAEDRAKWRVFISLQGKLINLGSSRDPVIAAQLYDRYVIERGLNRPLNFPILANLGLGSASQERKNTPEQITLQW
jgi:NUMOD3 motif